MNDSIFKIFKFSFNLKKVFEKTIVQLHCQFPLQRRSRFFMFLTLFLKLLSPLFSYLLFSVSQFVCLSDSLSLSHSFFFFSLSLSLSLTLSQNKFVFFYLRSPSFQSSSFSIPTFDTLSSITFLS